MQDMVACTFLVLAAALAAGVAGLLSAPVELFGALMLTAFACIVPARNPRETSSPRLLFAGIPALAAGLIAASIHPDDRAWRLLSLAVIFAAVGLIFRAAGRPRKAFSVAALTAFAAGLGALVLLYSPPAWNLWLHLSLIVSSFVGGAIARPLRLGPTYSGLEIVAIIMLAILSMRLFGLKISRRRVLFAVAWLGAVEIIYLVSMTVLGATQLPAPGPDGLVDTTAFTKMMYRYVPWNVPCLLLLLQVPALWIAARGATQAAAPGLSGDVRRNRLALISAAAIVLLAVAALVVRPVERGATTPGYGGPRPRVVFFEKANLSFSSPDNQSFGMMSSGMLGRLPEFLAENGFDLVRTRTVEDNDLAGARAFVILNPIEAFDCASISRLYRFVDQGGSLLVVGEHTWVSQDGKDYDIFTTLMAPSDIRVNFDSAYYHIGGWIDANEYFPDPLWRGLRQELCETGFGIGASLSAGWKAEPLLVGTYAFSDAGSRIQRPDYGYLGNSLYDPGEQLGDVVLAAEQRIGKGRVVVLGDTTVFFNALMVGSHQTVSRLFGKLSAAPRESIHWPRLGAALALLSGAVVLFLLAPKPSAAVVFAALAVLALVEWRSDAESAANAPVARGRVAIIDASHAEAFSRDTWRDDSLAGLYLNLMRNDVQPLVNFSWSSEALKGARMLFFIAPTRALSASEAADVERFIASGGTVVVSVDPDQAEAVSPLLNPRKLVVRNMPLGYFRTGFAQFWCAYVIQAKSDPDGVLRAKIDPAEVRADYGTADTPTIVERLAPPSPSHPRGGLLLIADRRMFYNQNVEPDKAPPIMTNVAFIRWLAAHLEPAAPAGGAR